MNLLLSLLLLLFGACNGSRGATNSPTPTPSAKQLAAIEKIRGELNEAFEAGEEAEGEGVIVQPAWTKQGHKVTASAPAPKVIVNSAALQAAKALRSEINEAVARQGHTEQVRQLEAAIKAKTGDTPGAGPESGAGQSVVGSARDEMLGSSLEDAANVVDAAPLDIDLAQLQQLELSKRRTREMLVLSRIEENLQFTLGEDVSHWLHLQQNATTYFVGQRHQELLLLEQQAPIASDTFPTYEKIQTLPIPENIITMISFERWNPRMQLQKGLVLLSVDQQLIWYRLEAGVGLNQFWQWPIGNITKMLPFVVENREYLVVVSNQTLSIYAHHVDALEFWIVQRLQLEEEITAIAVLDTGRDLLLAVGQSNEAIIYAHNMHDLAQEAGLQLQIRQHLDAPQIADIAAFQMGGRSYLALGGQRPQILAYVQGQLLPKTVLGQNFGLVELFLPVPVRSYRDDLLLLVQHRIYFDTHTLVQLEVLVWNGEAFEASLPPPCELGSLIRYGAGCMLDELRDRGMAGAALLRQVQPPLLLVPQQAAPSGLFRLHTELLPRNSELHDIQEIQEFMRNWVAEQDKVLQHAQQLIHASDPDPDTELEVIQYEVINTPLLISEGAIVGALYVNEVPWTTADAGTDLLQLLQQIRLLRQQLLDLHGRSRRQSPLFFYDYEQLDFDVVEVQELLVQKLNHVPFYIQNATLQFNGSINVQQLELLQPQLTEPPESLPSSTREQLKVSGDLTCDYINGLSWDVFQQEVIWRYKALQLSQLQVQGAVVFEDSLHLSALNELSFPEDYLWSQSSSTSIVRAPKQFTQTLTVNDVDTAGTINGRDPLDAITLSDAQDWPGLVTFTQLEVSEELQLNGTAQGRKFEEAPLNPTLLEAHHIHAACHFAHLVVNGPLQVHGLLDANTYDSLLGDLAQRSLDGNEELLIAGMKHVQQLTLPVDAHVMDGKLSGIPIEQFVTKHTNQTLHNVNSLDGYVYFHRLQLNGAFDGVHLQELFDQSLHVDAPLMAPSTRLQFVNDLELPQLQITRILNDVPLSGYQTLQEPLHLSQASFKSLQADQLDVAFNVTGAGRLNGRPLDELLSVSRQSDHVQVQELILPMGVEATKLQGLDADQLLSFLQQLDVLPLLILHGQLQVEQIAISGAVQVEGKLNGRNLDQLQREVVWLDQPNELRTRWRFQQPPIFASDLVLQGSYNQRLLPELLEDIIFRSDQLNAKELLIMGTKNFVGHVIVRDSLRLEALNGVPFNQLANKRQPLSFSGNLHLAGQLHVANVQLDGELNSQAVNQLEERLLWHPQLNAFVQRGLIHLPPLQLKDLTVLGHLGNRSLEPLQDFFANLLDKQQPQLRVEGHKIFTGRVSIHSGAHITELNGIQLKELLEQLIFLDGQDEVTLHSPVHFEAPVQMNQLQVDQLILQGERINGCNVTDWIYDTIRVDRDWEAAAPVTFTPGALDNNALQVKQLNHLNLSHVVTLHTEQHLIYPLLAQELQLDDGHVLLQGLVNGHNLFEEFSNTLLVNAPHVQHVETPLVMQSVHVLGSLWANSSTINGDRNLNLSDVATLREEQLHLKTPLYFDLLHAPELRTGFRINGFDYNAWYEKSLWAQGRATQVITGNWSVYWLRVKQPHEAEQAAHVLYRRQTTALAERHQELCKRLARLFGLLHLPYQVKQLRHSFELTQNTDQADLRRVFALKSPVKGVNYLLLNELGCWTRIHRWNGTHFANAGSFESGPIDDVVVLQLRNESNSDNDQFSFMTSYELGEEQLECSSLQNLQSWRTSAKIEIEPLGVPANSLEKLQQQHEAKQLQRRVPSYQDAIKYLNRPSIESQLRPHLDASHAITQEQYETLRERLLEHLSFRLQTEVNITQLSIPESDLYDDEHLVEDFLWLMHQLQRHAIKSGSEMFVALQTDTLPLPNSPARVLAARSSQLIWPVLGELRALHARLALNDSRAGELLLQLEQTVHDVLQLAYMGSNLANANEDDDTIRLHAVIERLRQLQLHLQPEQQPAESIMYTMSLPAPHAQQNWQPVQTIRLHVGPAQRGRLLYARLTIVAPDAPSVAPSTAPAAHIQLHHANGTLFQSLAADQRARQLTALRVLDETLLAFVEGCCQVRIFIYRGVQGFVPFAQFQTEADDDVLQLLALRLPLLQSPGALYTLAVVQARRIVFYELVIPGLFEPWLHC
ncbi:uncharacterized protein LOC117793982 [Drosophila innubila]|uniref:uncharacterized protein LOC117793982 n=1 Tax=Drosophila innubila TaxID=198719 RepID=UPI00148C1AB1|nr:uncharacterized protein LOC117793982 [Drosophila innubila]